MAKKYLSIEEAAAILGVEPVELTRMREKGDIRAFADRGTWKFREDDVEELARNRKSESGADIPMLSSSVSKPPKKDDLSSTIMFDDDVADEGSSIDLDVADKQLSEQPTIVRKGQDDLSASDSDVRLVFDDSLMPDNEPEAPLGDLQQSDSDVRLIPPSAKEEGSDSDVKLVSDSKARQTPVSMGSGSDSDVTLVGQRAASDDEISLDLGESDGSFVLGGEASGIALETGASPSGISGDSGIALDSGDDSGITIDTGNDSGISLDIGGDSGITLDTGSGIMLAGDSGISLAEPSDSGISLDSGMKTPPPKKPATKRPADDDDLGGTMPMLDVSGLDEVQDDLGATTMEVPLLTEQDSDYDISSTGAESSGSVVLGATDDEIDSNVFTDEEDEVETAEFESDDEMVVDEVLSGEDDEIQDDVFDAGDEMFDDGLQSGSSHADFVSPVGSRAAAPVEVEWGGGTFFVLVLASAVMLMTSFMMYELVRTMWGGNSPSAGTESILASLRGLFG